MDSEENSRPNPPYIPLMTLENFAGKLKAAVVPPVIDSSLTQSMSGGMAGALMSALKFLGLIDSSGKVQEPLKKLVAAHGTGAWNEVVAATLLPAYVDIVAGLDLTTATPAMLDECFRKRTKASGQVLDKAVRFYLAIMANAKTPISPLLKSRKPRNSSPKRGARSSGRKQSSDADDDIGDDDDSAEDGDAETKPRKLRLPVPGKDQEIIFIVPHDLTAEDWTFLQPIFNSYVERMLKAGE